MSRISLIGIPVGIAGAAIWEHTGMDIMRWEFFALATLFYVWGVIVEANIKP